MDSWVSSRRATRTLRVNWNPAPRRSKGKGEAPVPASGAPAKHSACLGEGGATSTTSRGDGGVGMDPGERVVVAMFPPSLGRFLDFWEGPTELLSVLDGGNISMLRRTLRSAACCLCLSRALTAADRSCTMISTKQQKTNKLETTQNRPSHKDDRSTKPKQNPYP